MEKIKPELAFKLSEYSIKSIFNVSKEQWKSKWKYICVASVECMLWGNLFEFFCIKNIDG